MMAKQMPKGLIIDPKCELHCKPRGQRMARKKDLRPCIEQGAGNGWGVQKEAGQWACPIPEQPTEMWADAPGLLHHCRLAAVPALFGASP